MYTIIIAHPVVLGLMHHNILFLLYLVLSDITRSDVLYLSIIYIYIYRVMCTLSLLEGNDFKKGLRICHVENFAHYKYRQSE